MSNNFLYMSAVLPSGFPEQIDVPQPFLEQINTPLGIWLVRILVIVAFVACLLYARYAPPANERSEQEQSTEEQQTLQRK